MLGRAFNKDPRIPRSAQWLIVGSGLVQYWRREDFKTKSKGISNELIFSHRWVLYFLEVSTKLLWNTYDLTRFGPYKAQAMQSLRKDHMVYGDRGPVFSQQHGIAGPIPFSRPEPETIAVLPSREKVSTTISTRSFAGV